MTPLQLALDCSGSRPTVALLAGPTVLREWLGDKELSHHEQLLQGIHHCLSQEKLRTTDLGFISVGIGPGMFTGLRIGVATAKFLADPLNISCVPVSSSLALAYQAGQEGKRVWAISDARAKRVYALCMKEFPSDFSPPEGEEIATMPDLLKDKILPGDFLIGEGAHLYRDLWPKEAFLCKDNFLSAIAVGKIGNVRFSLGLTCSALELEPKYLRHE